MVTKTAMLQVDNTRRVEQQVDVTQAFCQQCDLVVNDDLYGEFAKAHIRLVQLSAKTELSGPAQGIVAEILAKTRDLIETSDTDIEMDFTSVKHAWDAVRVLTIATEDFESVLGKVVQGNIQEGFSKIKIDAEGNRMVQINALGSGWRPYRILKNQKGMYAIYGHVTLYRYTGTT